MNPVTKQFIGTSGQAAVIVGTLVPGSGNLQRLEAAGQGHRVDLLQMARVYAPRWGAAWDVKGNQKFVVRGGGGMFFDRPSASNIYTTVNNPPSAQSITVRYGQLQDLSKAGLSTTSPSTIQAFQYESSGVDPMPTSVQWNGGVQMVLPWALIGWSGYRLVRHFGRPAPSAPAATLTLPAPATPPPASGSPHGPSARPRARGSADPARSDRGCVRAAVGDLPLHPDLPHAETQKRYLGRLQRHGRLVRLDQRDTAAAAQRRWDGHHCVPIKLRRRNCGQSVSDPPPDEGELHLGAAKLRAPTPKAVGVVVNDALGIWVGITSTPCPVGFTYQSDGGNLSLTGSPDYAARVRVVGTSVGCSSDVYRQFNTAFQGPPVGTSVSTRERLPAAASAPWMFRSTGTSGWA
jgi:hypothetical protein